MTGKFTIRMVDGTEYDVEEEYMNSVDDPLVHFSNYVRKKVFIRSSIEDVVIFTAQIVSITTRQ